MASSLQAAVTPAGIRDGDPAALAALVERRANAVLAYCEAVCPPAAAELAAAEAFARFRAAVAAAEDPRALDPETLLRAAARHAAAAMTVPPALPPSAGGLRSKLGAGRGSASETCALIPDLLAARAEGLLGAADQERLARHLERHAACRALAGAVDLAEAAYASPLPRTVPIGALTEIMLALAAAAPITAAPRAEFDFADVVLVDPEAPGPDPEAEADVETQPPDHVSPAQHSESEAYTSEPGHGPEAEAQQPGHVSVAQPQEPGPEPEPPARRPAQEPALDQPELEPELHPPAPEPGPAAHEIEAYQPETYPPAPEPGPAAYQSTTYQPAAYQQALEAEPGRAGDPPPPIAVIDDDTGHTLVFPAGAITGEAAAPPGGVAHPRPPRRPLHLPSAAGGHGVLFRYVLPGGAVAAALVAAMGVAGVFASDEGAPAQARPGITNVPAAPPTGAPPVTPITPETDVDAEERTAMAAERRARRDRAADTARRRAREAAQAAAPTTSTSTLPPAVVAPEPDPEPAPSPARTPPEPRKPASTVEKEPPAESSSSLPETGTETTPPADPGVVENTPPPPPPPP